jgi:hypothetical protein
VAREGLGEASTGERIGQPLSRESFPSQSTDRAQNRTTVSQALERIRKVAKERKKERFIALLHHISIDLLDEVFNELKENAACWRG